MKTAKRSIVRVIRFVIILFLSMSCIAVLGSGIASAISLPNGWTYVAGGGAGGGMESTLPKPQSLEFYDYETHPVYFWEIGANVNASFNHVEVITYAHVEGDFGFSRSVGAVGDAVYYFSITQFTLPPFIVPALPVSVETHGLGSFEGWGSFYVESRIADVEVFITGGPSDEPITKQFDLIETTWLSTDSAYMVDIWADTSSLAYQDWSIWDSAAYAVVDPIIRFDQAAFDAAYPDTHFNLSDYYQLDFSPNMVPEPATMLLLGFGLIGLAGFGRKKFFKK